MCQHCGCQSIPAIALLTEEHDAIVTIIGKIREDLRDGRLDAAASGCQQILAVLGPHTRVEEQGLFPPMRVEFPDQVDQLEAEHRSIEAVLSEAKDGTPADPQWPTRLRAALHDLRDHILKEQNGVFPASLAILRPEDWDLIDQIRAEGPAALS